MIADLLLDEHVPSRLRTQLLRRIPTLRIWRVGEPGAPAIGTADPELLAWCEANSFVLITNNRHTMPAHLAAHLAAGRHLPGILTVDLSSPFGLLLDEVLLFVEAARPEDLQDQIRYLPLT
jgi:hypothetical protein